PIPIVGSGEKRAKACSGSVTLFRRQPDRAMERTIAEHRVVGHASMTCDPSQISSKPHADGWSWDSTVFVIIIGVSSNLKAISEKIPEPQVAEDGRRLILGYSPGRSATGGAERGQP